MKFYATDGTEYWQSDPGYREQKLAQLCDGTLVVLSDEMRNGWTVKPLPPQFKYTEVPPVITGIRVVEKVKCRYCFGSGTVSEIVDHDSDGAVYESCQCGACHGTGRLVIT